MDPNENLKQQRACVQEIERYLASPGGTFDRVALEDAAMRLADLTQALDQWLCSGGFKPTAWSAEVL